MKQGLWNKLAEEIHQNAVAHGWYDKEPSLASVINNIHAELSEAWEEYRKGRPMCYFECENIKDDDRFGRPCSPCGYGKPEGPCDRRGEKPEGIAVELADAVMRMLDTCAHMKIDIDGAMEKTLTSSELDEPQEWRLIEQDTDADMLPALIKRLHDYMSMAYKVAQYGYGIAPYVAAAIYVTEKYVQKHALTTLEQLIRMKHAYNITRPYKHGGLVI